MRGKKSKSPPQRHSQIRKAEKKFAERMRAIGKKPAPTLGQVEAQFKASAAQSQPLDAKGVENSAKSVSEKAEEGNHGSDYSVNALSKLLGHDRRTLDKALVGIEPARIEGKTKFYKLADVEKAVRQRSSTKLKDQKLVEEIRKLRIANDKAEGLTRPKAKVIASIQRCMPPVATMLEQRLVNEYPTAVAGLDVPQIRIYGRRLADELMAFFHNLQGEWT